MKKVLITGKNSYIGISLKCWLNKGLDSYIVETIDVKTEDWKEKSFSGYHTIIHTAAIVHLNSDKLTEEIYFKINRDLATEIASKAKKEGVKQFIFLSSMSVYGENISLINKDTKPCPTSLYGKSKLAGEANIKALESENFLISILRPPMVYGKNAKGNYKRLSKLAKFMPIFPSINNKRSMIFIDNLCELIKLIIDNEESGLFFPQNSQYVDSSQMFKTIRAVSGKKTFLISLFNPIIIQMMKIKTINKVFGDLIYDKSLSNYDKGNYQIIDFYESIKLTEK